MADTATTFCVVCCVITSLTILILLLNAFSSIQTNEFGLDYSGISKQIDSTIYTSGIHFLGVGHHFIKFPKTVITIDFSDEPGAHHPPIISRTSDGLEVDLGISFQYILEPQNLYQLYYKFNDNYQKVFELVAVDVLTTNATSYSAYDFFIDRQKITANMQEQLNLEFKYCCYSSVAFFQLKKVNLPKQFENAIQESEVKKQEIQKAYANKSKTIIELDTKRKTAEFQKNVTVNLAQGDASQIECEGQAQADSIMVRQKISAESYKKLKDSLGLSNEDLLDYIQKKVIRQYKGSNMTVSMHNPSHLAPKSALSHAKKFLSSDDEMNQNNEDF